MSDEKEILEEDLEYDILTLVDDDGEEHQFELADSLEHEGKEYYALIPVFENTDQLLEDSGELVIMQVATEDGEDFLDPVDDPAEYEAVSGLFMARLSDQFDFDEDPE